MRHAASVIAVMSNVVELSSGLQMRSEPQAACRRPYCACDREEMTRY
jgi:hypothetical protein